MQTQSTSMFPELERFVQRTGLLSSAKGILSARLPRILGQGRTRAEGLDLPPSVIERQQELLALKLPDEAASDQALQDEIAAARRAVEEHAERMRHSDGQRRFAMQVLHLLEDRSSGSKDNQFYAGRLVLVPEKSGQNWAWSVTPHYPVTAKIPADIDYVLSAYRESERVVKQWTLPVDRFLDRLSLAWTMARHFSDSENVLIADVARLFKIAVQDDAFWGSPARRNYSDVPEAAFVANLINWRHNRDEAKESQVFELVPATLNQAHGPRSRAFFVPGNAEGTVVRPMIYIRKLSG
jgi:hypothetical protein